MSFSEALIELIKGNKLKRKDWTVEYIFLVTKESVGGLKFRGHEFLPMFYRKTIHGQTIPWSIHHEDILTNDWEIMN